MAKAKVFLESDHTLTHQHDQLQDADVQGNDVVIVPQRLSPARTEGQHFGEFSGSSTGPARQGREPGDEGCQPAEHKENSPESSLSSLPG
jgi:hypothetical protein